MNSDEQAFVKELDRKLMDAMLTVDARPLDKPIDVAEVSDINWLKGELNDAHMSIEAAHKVVQHVTQQYCYYRRIANLALIWAIVVTGVVAMLVLQMVLDK